MEQLRRKSNIFLDKMSLVNLSSGASSGGNHITVPRTNTSEKENNVTSSVNNVSVPSACTLHKKPLRIKNVATKAEAFDSLYQNANLNGMCTNKVCMGTSMQLGTSNSQVRSTEELLADAKEFLDQYFLSIRRSDGPSHMSRWGQVQAEVEAFGKYKLTETELIYGAKQAWRNSVRCIGRIQWSKLQVFDCRFVTTTSGMFDALCNHIKYSTNKGNIRSAITIFPQRTDTRHDYRVWNPQLISYAGYRRPDGSILGDPINAEFTDICLQLGWRGPGTQFDILPLVLSANGHDPDYFDIPSELVIEVNLSHPTFDWFENLGLKWYVLPAVSGMMFDCGGIQFTACPFNGWYMSTEIGCRDLCDTGRYNMLEPIALAMGLDTRSSITLWKDRALVEANVSVLHSFQKRGVTIMDHHTASESFMKHLENETRLRRGCPADWVWIVPPMSGSITPVFHQEMAVYYLRPSYDYQEAAWKTHIWNKQRETDRDNKKPRRKFHFKQIARAVRFASKLFGRALSRRIKATVLYATETGKSEGYAKMLKEILGHAFNAQVHCMADYDISNIEHEALLLVVTSTFGNGDPPENGEEFAKNLYALKLNESRLSNGHGDSKLSMATSKSFIKANSQTDIVRKLDRFDSLRSSVTDQVIEDTFGPLSNVRYAVFALGSSAYPNFCAFGKYVDNLLGELGGERLLKMVTGDEMCAQEQAFRKWAPEVYKLSCEAFCLDDEESMLGPSFSFNELTAATVRFMEVKPEPMEICLTKCHNKNVSSCKLSRRTNLHGENASRVTLKLEISTSLPYNPGDHVGIYPKNRSEIVNGILEKLSDKPDPDVTMELQVLKETQTFNEVVKTWTPHEKLPPCTLRELFTRFLDITTPPTPNLLQQFAAIASDENDVTKLKILSTDSTAYEDWRHWRTPHLLEVLEEFPSVKPHAALLVARLGLLQPRFYSISSSKLVQIDEIHLTVAVVTYRTQDGNGVKHYGICSNYLQDTDMEDDIYLFVRSAPSFHLPSDPSKAVILVGPGTGIAPFRSFWQHRSALLAQGEQLGKCWLFFGCRQKQLDLYTDEKERMVEEKVLDRTFLALSREINLSKTYVQDLVLKDASDIYKMLVLEKGHFYVCGDVTMANNVYQTIKTIIIRFGNMTNEQGEQYMLTLRDENRYHEDIFGITLRTAEIQNKSRETARIRMASEP